MKTSTLEKLLKDSKLNDVEIKHLLQSSPQAPHRNYKIGGTKVIYGVLSDSHIGHKCYDAELTKFAVKIFNKRDVDFIIHGGDICEGHYENKRQGSVFELEHIGGDAQCERAIKELKQFKQPIYAITGNHCGNTFFKNSGFDIGKRLAEQVPNFVYLGMQHGSIELSHGNKIQLIHPDGGSSYAISYKPQKIVESLEGGTKPEILHIGHFHKAEYLFYRNIQVIQNGCQERQTPLMKNNHLAAHVGFWVITANFDSRGVTKFTPEFYPGY